MVVLIGGGRAVSWPTRGVVAVPVAAAVVAVVTRAVLLDIEDEDEVITTAAREELLLLLKPTTPPGTDVTALAPPVSVRLRNQLDPTN